MNDIKSLIEQCTKWSEDRLIFKNGRRETQMLKLMEEMGELASSIAKGRDVRDDIGDILVVVNNVAGMSGTTLEECLGIAYYQIKDRKGFLNGNGVFIKEEETMR
jgi:NTP pyrophosphatase (non-canonical NTP hydrolase)